MIYGEFASFYDALFDNDLYNKWLNFVNKNVEKDGTVLDLACGTGRFLVLLKKIGYQVLGADLSDEMLAIASSHLSDAGIFDVPLIEADMLDLSQLPAFNAITCFDDSICYLNDLAQVHEMFRQVFSHLEPGGKFLFDVITPYQTDVLYPGYMYNVNDGDHAFMWNSFEGETRHSVIHDLSFFDYNQRKDAFDEYSETHYERTYTLDEYQQALISTGFNSIKVTADFGDAPISDKTDRWFFVCQK